MQSDVEQSLRPLNIAAATLLVQLMLVTLITIASSIYKRHRHGWESETRTDENLLRSTPTLLVALSSFALLLVSEDLYSIWSPIFLFVGINTISTTAAINSVFLLDLGLVTYLMAKTGGSHTSPFQSVLFTIPALAIFLRLPPSSFILYAVLAAVVYTVLFAPNFEPDHYKPSAGAFMTIACLALSMFTGYITRPVAIDELSPKAEAAASPNRAASANR